MSREEEGITPAHAGKSVSKALTSGGVLYHPRTRGEKWSIPSPLGLRIISPPHTRGKVTTRSRTRSVPGITPAHAGKSSGHQIEISCYGDHPRTRGEKEVFDEKYPEGEGSPPHTRGKEACTILNSIAGGITPAHAGKSFVKYSVLTIPQDHPRTRGEKRVLVRRSVSREGSPPHTRGKVP